jgi:hypothetical protein
MALTGDLTTFNFADILQVLAKDTLLLSQSGKEKSFYSFVDIIFPDLQLTYKLFSIALLYIDDIKDLVFPVMRHRILPNFNAEAEGLSTDDILVKLLEAKS